MSIAERIRSLRLGKGVSQAEMAEKLEISQALLCQIERGSKAPSLPVAINIARILGVTLNDLVEEDRKVG